MKRVFCILLVAAVLLASLPAGAGAAAVKFKDNVTLYSSPLEGWFYVPATLPASVQPAEVRGEVRLTKSSWMWNEEEKRPEDMETEQYPDTVTISFAGGEKALKDALTLSEQTEEIWVKGEKTEKQIFYLSLNNDALTVPGTAKFHIHAESENYIMDTDIPLYVLSWEEEPLLVFREAPEPLAMKVGDRFDDELLADVLLEEVRFKPIEEKLGIWMNRLGYREIQCPNDESQATEEVPNSYGRERKIVGGGSWDAEYILSFNNIRYTGTVPMKALKYWLKVQGKTMLKPGESASFTVSDMEPEKGRTFTLALEGGGEGVILDEKAGKVIAGENAQTGKYTLTATPSDGGDTVSVNFTVGSGLLAGVGFELREFEYSGFFVPYPTEADGFTEYGTNYYLWNTEDKSLPNELDVDYSFDYTDDFLEDDPEAAKAYYEKRWGGGNPAITLFEDETIEPEEGHPARLFVYRVDDNYGETFSRGLAYYVRNNICVTVRLSSYMQNIYSWEELPKVEKEDMIRLLKEIRYDPSKAYVTTRDADITLSTKEGVNAVTAGKKLTFLAAFADPEKVKKVKGYNAIEWSVADPATGEAPEGASISNKGVLSTAKGDAVRQLEVRAYSPLFRTSAVFPVTVIPAVNKLSVEPAELFFYTGTEASAAVKAILDPGTVPPLGITWTAAKDGIVEITPNEADGTAVIRPVSGGKTVIAVKEPGGKNAKLAVSVVDPAEDVTLEVKGNPVPGGSVTVKETVLPKQAGNKAVEWTLNVGEDIATFSKGKLKISKTAPAGTVILLTCTALGAPEPVVRTVEIKVAD